MHWVEHGADMVVGRDGRHPEQALAVRHLPPVLQRALVGEERLALQEEQREGRQADIRHAVGHLAAPLVGEGRAGRANALQKGLKHLHAGLNHTSSQGETLSSHQPFRIAGFAGGQFAWVTPPWRGPQAEHSSAPRPRQAGCCRSAREDGGCFYRPPPPKGGNPPLSFFGLGPARGTTPVLKKPLFSSASQLSKL